MRLRDWYVLTKPGIVYGNILHALAGVFIAAASFGLDITSSLGVIFGIAALIASACVVNNYIDRDIDAKMSRTQKRPSVMGNLRLVDIALFAGILALIGFVLLALTVNWLTFWLGALAYVWYSWLYTYSKRVTVHSTVIGVVPGALPAMAGYTALSGQIDLTAIVLFTVVALWQLPHFYAISLFRKEDYRAADIPIASCVWSLKKVKRVMMVTVLLYWLSVVALAIVVLSLPAGLLLFFAASYMVIVTFWKESDTIRWARRVFGVSLIATLSLGAAGLLHVLTSGLY